MIEVSISAKTPLDRLSWEIKRAFAETEICDSFKLKPDWAQGSIYVRKETRDTCTADTASEQLRLPIWTRKPMSVQQLLQSVIYTILQRNKTENSA